jgi:4'-phosphopantetheinyl transferase
MKGETLPEGTRWEGSPARPAQRLTLPPTPAPPMPGGSGHDQVRLFLDAGDASTPLPAELNGDLVLLSPDALGRPRAQDGHGRSLSLSVARAPGARLLALARVGRIGVDLEALRPSSTLEAAADLFLPTERAWVAGLPEPLRWRALLALWTAKEAVLKALGQGLGFGLDQIELGPDGRGGVLLRRLCGSEALALGWRIEHQERGVAGQRYLVALATSGWPRPDR